MNKIGIAAVALLSLSTTAIAETVESIKILEFGIYDGQRTDSARKEPATPEYAGLALRTKTDQIPATVGVKFGVAYVPVGSPNGAPARISLVTRFPPAGIIDSTGKRHQKEEIVKTDFIGLSSYRIFEFSAPWRVLPGDWVFEFYYGDHKIGEKHFNVFEQKNQKL